MWRDRKPRCPCASRGQLLPQPRHWNIQQLKLLGFINKVAANLYRDPALNLFGVAEKVKALINAHISARGVDPKIPPTAITDAEFEKVLQVQTSSRARAAQMQHAARYHIIGFESKSGLCPEDERTPGGDSPEVQG